MPRLVRTSVLPYVLPPVLLTKEQGEYTKQHDTCPGHTRHVMIHSFTCFRQVHWYKETTQTIVIFVLHGRTKQVSVHSSIASENHTATGTIHNPCYYVSSMDIPDNWRFVPHLLAVYVCCIKSIFCLQLAQYSLVVKLKIFMQSCTLMVINCIHWNHQSAQYLSWISSRHSTSETTELQVILWNQGDQMSPFKGIVPYFGGQFPYSDQCQ